MKEELFKQYVKEVRLTEWDADVRAQKIECLNVARDFGYPRRVFDAIVKATSINRLNTIMHSAIKYIY